MAPTTEVAALLARRRGLVFVESEGAEPALAWGLAHELARLGYVPSTRLQERLGRASGGELAGLHGWLLGALAAELGANQKHEPLFRKFPEEVPADTHELWCRKVLSHYRQGEQQPCLFCRRSGVCHVLSPCRHVVCDQCFDGASYSACPVCEQAVDRSSPFFAPTTPRREGREQVRYKLLDLGEGPDDEARALFGSLCARPQALSPVDGEALQVLLRGYGQATLGWLPDKILVKETTAAIFGALFRQGDPEPVLAVARRHLATATDVLRFVASFSGADPSLQGEMAPRKDDPRKQAKKKRFKVARLGRGLRRALLALLDGMPEDRLTEDMLRHRSYWVWVGEFLHPHEYATRFPAVARAFAVVRKKGPDGAEAPRFFGYYSRLDAVTRGGDVGAMVGLLLERPGELGRRLDHALRVAQQAAPDDPGATRPVVEAFARVAPALTTPLLLTLHALLPTRTHQATRRLFWPKGQVAKGKSLPDGRPTLTPDAVGPAVRAVEAELLRRFREKKSYPGAIIDAGLRDIIVPFNERTASPAAVALPRGSRVAVPQGKAMRLFLHWCEPEQGGQSTDLDLSVAFYDGSWGYRGVCSYYELKYLDGSDEIAVSAGDLRDAPYPDGATEFVDVHREEATLHGVRYAVAVVNSYRGMPFDRLERGFAGLMLRDDVSGAHFDPRTVALRFNLQGANGVFLPFVVDLSDGVLHWLDVYSKGELTMNNVATSNRDITRLCPEMIEYFASGVRASMFDLAALHAASRCERVFVRDGQVRLYARRPGETRGAFFARLRGMDFDALDAPLPGPGDAPALAALLRGDLELPAGSLGYALFRERGGYDLSASDLLA